jgi:hypothetical protein
MRGEGHVVLCGGGKRNVLVLSGCNNNEKNLFGRPRQKWEAISEMDVM